MTMYQTSGLLFYSITLQEHILADPIQMTGKLIVGCLGDLNIPLLSTSLLFTTMNESPQK